jgi:hypothetical protein
MVDFEDLRAMVLALPDTEETTSWDARSFKVNGKVILYWNPTHDCPVFKVDREERDFLIEADRRPSSPPTTIGPMRWCWRARTGSTPAGRKPTSSGSGAPR